MKIGFFGGSFNPPTNAHMYIAKEALEKCKLDKVIFVPMGDFYKKAGLANAKDRYNMLKIACKDMEKLEVSDLEIKINRKLHTVEAFRLIKDKYPNEDRYFIMGADNFVRLPSLKESKELINDYKYIVIERDNIELEKYIRCNKDITSHIENIKIIENKCYKSTSSTEFRNLVFVDKNEKQNIIPKEVYEYIINNNIYNFKRANN